LNAQNLRDRRDMTGEPPKSWWITEASAQASFMITLAQKQQLRELGYSEAAISAMTPEDAHRILGLRA
jgi:hypothetical protein